LIAPRKGEEEGEEEGEGGIESGLVGVWGVRSSLTIGELSLKEDEGWG
jgi:hypothetical protein